MFHFHLLLTLFFTLLGLSWLVEGYTRNSMVKSNWNQQKGNTFFQFVTDFVSQSFLAVLIVHYKWLLLSCRTHISVRETILTKHVAMLLTLRRYHCNKNGCVVLWKLCSASGTTGFNMKWIAGDLWTVRPLKAIFFSLKMFSCFKLLPVLLKNYISHHPLNYPKIGWISAVVSAFNWSRR